jgi:hypothetical protein
MHRNAFYGLVKECVIEVLRENLSEGFDPLSQGPNPVAENPYPAWNSKMRQLEEDEGQNSQPTGETFVDHPIDPQPKRTPTFQEIRDQHDPDGKQHDLRLICVKCGTSETCRCSKPKRKFEGICRNCSATSLNEALELTPTGTDDWSRPTYTDNNGNTYVDINLGNGEPSIHSTTPEGEPEVPVQNYTIVGNDPTNSFPNALCPRCKNSKPERMAKTTDGKMTCTLCHWEDNPGEPYKGKVDDGFDKYRATLGEKKVNSLLAKFGLGPDYKPSKPQTHECPKCGGTNAVYKEIHADTDMNDMELQCPDCNNQDLNENSQMRSLEEAKPTIPLNDVDQAIEIGKSAFGFTYNFLNKNVADNGVTYYSFSQGENRPVRMLANKNGEWFHVSETDPSQLKPMRSVHGKPRQPTYGSPKGPRWGAYLKMWYRRNKEKEKNKKSLPQNASSDLNSNTTGNPDYDYYIQNAGLSEREMKIVMLKLKGYSDSEIAGMTNVVKSTIKRMYLSAVEKLKSFTGNRDLK